MWMDVDGSRRLWRLRWRVKPWPSPHLSTGYPTSSHGAGGRLFSSASDLRCDRRDPDHGRAGGGGAIRQGHAGRACASAGAHAEAARSGAWPISKNRRASCCTRCSRRIWSSGWRASAASSVCRVCRSSVRCCTCSKPIWAPNRPIRSAPSTRSMPSISAASMRSTTRCCMMTASRPTISKRPTSCWSAFRAPRKRRPRSISPIAASRPRMCRWCPACRCRPRSSG